MQRAAIAAGALPELERCCEQAGAVGGEEARTLLMTAAAAATAIRGESEELII